MSKNIKYVLIMFLLIAMGCKQQAKEESAEEHHDEDENVIILSKAQMETAGVELGKVEEKQISGTIKVNGVLDVPPQQLVSISAPLGGFLKHTELLQGSRVKKGQLIATLENIDFIQIQQDYVEAKSNFEFSKADYERQQALAQENVNSQKTVQQAKTNYATWQAKYNGLKEKLRVLNLDPSSVEQGVLKSSINLFSPINGFVTEVNVNIGKFVNPTDVLFEIVDTEHLHAELIVFERDVPKLKIGQKVRFTLANETTERMATVYLIGREISRDRTVQIHCHIDKEDREFLPGMYLNGVVETGGARVTAVPDEAVIDYQGKKYLFVIADETNKENSGHAEEGTHAQERTVASTGGEVQFIMVPVETGNHELGYTEVILPDNFDRETPIAVKGAYALMSKLKNSEEEEGHAH